jgi:hypothetical protein
VTFVVSTRATSLEAALAVALARVELAATA